MARPQVVIVGAGFGGIDCARELADEAVDVTLIDRHNFHTFQPLLYQVATAGLSASDVAYPVRGLFQDASNVRVRTGEVVGVDWAAGEVRLADGAALTFDHLVVATGATTNFFGVTGAAERAFPLYALSDAIRLRNHVIGQFERVDADPGLAADGALTFVVLGGGPTGVETSGALIELFSKVLAKDFRHTDVSAARVVLVEMADTVLAPFSRTAQRHALDQLRRRGVEVRLTERVTAVDADSVTLASGEVIPTATVVWAAGVKASPLAAALGVAQGAGGRIVVTPELRIPAHPDSFVIGDLALALDTDGRPLPQVAQVAKQSGRYVGRILARPRPRPRPRAGHGHGHAPGPFRYRDRGTMATVGRNSAVGDLPFGIRLTGFIGWIGWLLLHLLYLVGFRNRLSVLVSWAWSYVTWDRGPRLIIEPGCEPD